MKWTIFFALTQYTRDLAYAEAGLIRKLQPEPDMGQDDFYYPTALTRGICSNDVSERPSRFTEIGFTLFETRDECCDYWYYWQEKRNCHRNEEVSAARDDMFPDVAVNPGDSTSSNELLFEDSPLFYYPKDLVTGTCSNDASLRPSNFDSLGFTLFFTAEQCCEYWYGWQEDKTCLLNISADPITLTMSPVASPVSNPDSDGGGGNDGSDGGDDGSGGDDGDGDTGIQSDGKFFLVDDVCTSSASGVTGEQYFSTQKDCCTNIQDFESRKSCCNESVSSPADQLRCLLEEPADPIEEEKFYFSEGRCISASDGEMDGYLYDSRAECCDVILPIQDRHACLWNQSENTSNPQPDPVKSTPSSASQLAFGSYVISGFLLCLSLQCV